MIHRRLLVRCLALVLCAALSQRSGAVQVPQEPLAGTWDGAFEPPGVVGGDPFSLQVSAIEGESVRGTLVLPTGALAFAGKLERARGALTFGAQIDGDEVAFELSLHGETLAGLGKSKAGDWGFRAFHVAGEVLERSHAPRAIELGSKERPETFSLVGLPTEVGLALDERIRAVATQNKVVGVTVACVVDGELVDVRSLGWEDFVGGVPASAETRYRWASISKPLTAATALRLVARGAFDLDRDVRALVPEFPEKKVGGQVVTITPRRILCHQSGIVHYDGAQRTWKEYATPHPFEELVNGLDLFASSPLLAAPGTLYSYSTHAWTLLGLALERAAQKRYAELVKELVLAPLDMKETEPDYPSHAIPHRAKGYEVQKDGRVLEAFDDDVSWKLPGGGWISTAGDLARFGAGLLGTKLLDAQQKSAAWSAQKLADGKVTDVGLGFFIGQLDGERLISHSGGQRKTSTFLALLPEKRLAVAVMCNTEGAPMEEIAKSALRLLLTIRRRP